MTARDAPSPVPAPSPSALTRGASCVRRLFNVTCQKRCCNKSFGPEVCTHTSTALNMTGAVRSFIALCFLFSQGEEPLQMKTLEGFCHRLSAWAGSLIYSLDWGREEAPADILDGFFPEFMGTGLLREWVIFLPNISYISCSFFLLPLKRGEGAFFLMTLIVLKFLFF